MTIIGIGSAIAGGVGSIFGAKANAAAAELRNQQALQQWISRNTQKTFNNARQQFQATQATIQQAKRNSAIIQAAYKNQFNRQNNIKDQINFQKSQMAVDAQITRALLINAAAGKNIGQNSGTQSALIRSQMLNMIANNNQLQKNYLIQKQDIENQFQSEMAQQTEQVFMPNIELYDAQPIFEDTSYSALPGVLQIATGLAGAAYGMSGSGTESGFTPNEIESNLPSDYNRSNNAYTNQTSGGSVGGR